MKKGIRTDQNNRKVLTSKKIYDCVATEMANGRKLELHKSYVNLQIFSDNGFIKTVTDYKCPYCNNKEKTAKEIIIIILTKISNILWLHYKSDNQFFNSR